MGLILHLHWKPLINVEKTNIQRWNGVISINWNVLQTVKLEMYRSQVKNLKMNPWRQLMMAQLTVETWKDHPLIMNSARSLLPR